jgi:two-component system cell cycle sensor histidine kinase/response regulator CckA
MTHPRILVVEDEGIVAMEIRNRLASMGYVVVAVVAAGELAIEKAGELQPDLVLMDIRLKGKLDGISAAEQIRAQFDIPVIFLTAYADEHTLQRAKVTEPYGYVLKPFEERELHIAMEVALYKHRIEHRLKENEHRLATTLNSIGDAVVATDINGAINFMNQAAEILTGWTQQAALGQNGQQLLQFVDEKTHTALESPIAQAIHRGVMVNLGRDTLLITRASGQTLTEGQVSPIRDETNRMLGVVLVFRDVTEQRKIENELLKMQRLESLGLLAGGIAHKFNNFLAAIISNIALIKLRTRREEAIYGKLESVEKTAWKAADAAQQLLTFSKGGAPIKKATSIIEIITAATELGLRGANTHYQLALGADLWPVDVDQGQICQVFTNLFMNADQAMAEGGIIQVCAENIQFVAKSDMGLAPGRYLHVWVKDQGIGIPKNLLPRIFDPYFTTKPNASGLGLTTAYSIVQRHAGHIMAESEAGQGATFHVYLPVAEQNLETPAPLSTVQQEALPGQKRILLMDDEDVVRECADDVLKHLGYQVAFAKDGMEAIETYQQANIRGEPFDAVILDLTVQNGMGGKEAIRQLLTIDNQVKAIVSSGYSHDPVMANFREHGFRGVLAKPYTIEELNKTLSQILLGTQGYATT